MELHTSFQPEVLNPALGLVGVTGLSSITDKTSNGQDAIEATVWEILSIRKTPTGATRTPPIHFIPLTKNHLFPPKKTKAAPPLPPGRHLHSPPPATGTTVTTSGTMYDDPLHAHHHHQVPTTLPPSLLSQSPYQHLHSNSSGSSGSGTPPPASPTGGVPPAITSLLSSSPLGMSHLNASVSSLGAFSSAGSLSQYPGILKANWLPKHFSRQPGLVVSFYHHDQYDPDWRNRDGVIINEILERKRNLQERGIRFIVVLLAIDSKPNADMKVPSNERMSILKNSCGLDKTTLYVYFPSHNIREFLINLEKSLYELLSTHYRDQGKRVRQMLDKLHAPMDLPLIVRYNFKIGAFSELRQDLKTAVKHYSLAYEALLECLPAQSNLKLIEIKCVGEIINYKMCKLLMFGTLPEAFDQFDLHLKSFIPLQGTIELIDFEHWAFVAKQCRAFADMLDVAIRQGHLLKDHNQHPGYYYMMAAKYSVQRKLKRGPPLKTQPENPSVPQMPIYVGQLPPKLDHPLDNPENPFELDQAAEAEFVAVAREKESKIDYSPIIVDHLSKAYEQFKKFKETRMTLHTASQIAQEYYESENYEKALKFFERIAKSYRKDNWNTILRDILLMSFVCAKNLQKTDAAIGYASELISEDLGLEVPQRKEIQRELAVMLKVPSPSIDPQAGPMVLETDQITSFVSCKVQFHKADYSVGEEAWLSLVVSVNCPLPIRFGSIRIFFLPRELSHVFFDHSTELIPSNIKEQQPASSAVDFVDCRGSTWSDSVYQKELDLLFHPKKIRVFEIPLKVKKAREIKCSLISFHLDAGGRQISFQHKIPEDPQFDLGEHRQANVGVLRKAAGSSAWLKKTSIREVKEYPITRIHLRQLRVKLDVSSQGSPVLDEWFPLRVLIFNKENHPIEGLFDVDFRSAEAKDLKTFVAMGIADLPGKEKLTDVPIGLIPAGEGKEVVCFVRGHRSPGDRLVKIKVRYHELLEDQTKGEECAVEKEEKLAFGKPFQVGANVARQQIVSSLQAVHFGQVDYASLGREDLFSLAVSIKPSSDAPIVVTDVSLCPVLQESGKGSNPEAILESFDENVTSVKMVSESKDLSPKPWHWTVDEIHKFHFLLKITSKSSTVLMTGILPIGYLQITWRREDVSLPSDGFVATTKVPIVSAEDVKRSLTITTETPSFAQVGEAFPVTYTIGNPSNQVVEASASLESHESFMFSGFRQCSFRLLPFSSHSLTFNCFPTQSGRHSLPLLNLLDKRQDSPLPIGPIVLLVKPPLSVKPQ